MTIQSFFSPRLSCRTAWLIFIATQAAWYLWAVPSTYKCEHSPKVTEGAIGGGTMTRLTCLSPEFDLPCHSSSLTRGEFTWFCRTLFHRPIKLTDLQAINQHRCTAELGIMATYDPDAGCQCLLAYGKLVDNVYCAPRDLYCVRKHGSGAIIVDPDGGYDFRCDCQPPLTMNQGTGKCE